MRACVETFGRLDILINNAGVIEPIESLMDATPDAWGHVIDINVKGVFHGMRAALPVMMAEGGGTILTISSGAAHGAMGLSPGTVATQMQREIKASGVNPVSQLDWDAHIPADWPAKALLWMCSPDADAFLGEEISLRDEDIRRRAGLIA